MEFCEKKSFSTLQKSAQGTENQSLLPLFFQATIHDQEALALLVVFTIIELAVLFSTESSPTTIALRLELLFPQLFRYLRSRTGDPLAIR